MMVFKKLATAGVVAVIGLGAGAAGASAYSISGGAFTGTATSVHTATVGGSYTFECSTAAFAGTATGSATASLTPSYSGCTYFGFPGSHTSSGPWDLTVTGGPWGGLYTGRVAIPAGTSVTVAVPMAGCTVVNDGPQSFDVVLWNVPGGVEAEASISGIEYTASGCPFSSGSDGAYETNGIVSFPGITIS